MKNKILFLLSITLLTGCNINDNTSVNSSNSQSIASLGELKEEVSVCEYFCLNDINKFNRVVTFHGNAKKFYTLNLNLPDFCLACDYILMKYYGEIRIGNLESDIEEYDSMTFDNGYGKDVLLYGEIFSIEYIKTEAKKVTYEKIYDENTSSYKIKVDNQLFEYVVKDKKYNITLPDELNDNIDIYASYYNNIPYGLYSFGPLV